MHAVSNDFATVVMPLNEAARRVVEKQLCKKWKVSRIDFFDVNFPEILFAHGVNNPAVCRLCSNLSNSLIWQKEKHLAIVSCQPGDCLTEQERVGFLTQALSKLNHKFPKILIEGLVLNSEGDVIFDVETSQY